MPQAAVSAWAGLARGFALLCERTPTLAKSRSINHLGTLGTGNHFIELCLDEADALWVMLHSGSRGVGNRIGTVFIELAKKEIFMTVSHLCCSPRHSRDLMRRFETA